MVGVNGLVSCKQDEPGSNTSSDFCKAIVIDAVRFEEATTDEYTLSEVQVRGDSLLMTVEYGGGCGAIDYELLTQGYFAETNPVQLAIRLWLEDNDPCEALARQSICLDLSPLASLYRDDYQNSHGTIVLHLQGYEDELEYTF